MQSLPTKIFNPFPSTFHRQNAFGRLFSFFLQILAATTFVDIVHVCARKDDIGIQLTPKKIQQMLCKICHVPKEAFKLSKVITSWRISVHC